MPVPNNRNSVGQGSIVFYVLGVLCAAVGLYLSTITQINLLSGQMSSPYLSVGIPLVIVGIVVVVLANQAAKRNLRR